MRNFLILLFMITIASCALFSKPVQRKRKIVVKRSPSLATRYEDCVTKLIRIDVKALNASEICGRIHRRN